MKQKALLISKCWVCLCFLVLFSTSSCISKKETKVYNYHSLDQNHIDKLVLRGSWKYLEEYLKNQNPQHLIPNQRADYFYWSGVAHYYQGQAHRAKRFWTESQQHQPQGETARRLKTALSKIDSGHQAQGSALWMVQLGIFSRKPSADKLFSELSWNGYDVKVSRILRQGEDHWIVYLGPFPSRYKAEQQQDRFEARGLNSFIKSYPPS